MFRRNVAILSMGTIASQSLLLLATPVLTRYYSPAAFGVFATFSALYTVVAGVGTLRYELAVPSQVDEARAISAGSAAVFSSILLVAVAGALAVGYMASGGVMPGWVFFLLTCVAFSALYGVGQQWASRERTFSRYALSLVVGPTVNVASSIAFALLGYVSGHQLVMSFTLGLLASVGVMLWPGLISSRMREAFENISNMGQVIHTMRMLREFPTFALPTYVAATMMNALPVLILGLRFSHDQVGYYAVAMRFLLAPSALVGGAISEALRAELFRIRREGGKVTGTVLRVVKAGALLGLPALVIAWMYGGDILLLLVGQQFNASGQLVPFLAIGAIALIVLQPLQSVFLVCGRQRRGLFAQLLLTFVPGVAMWCATFLSDSLVVAVATYALAIVSMGILYIVAALKVSRLDDAVVEVGDLCPRGSDMPPRCNRRAD